MKIYSVSDKWTAPRGGEKILVSEMGDPDIVLRVRETLGANEYAEWQVSACLDVDRMYGDHVLWVERRSVWGSDVPWRLISPNRPRPATVVCDVETDELT